MKKFILGIIICIGGILSFCSATSYNFSLPFVYGTTTLSFANTSYKVQAVTTISKTNIDKYFCFSNVYYNGNSSNINNYLGSVEVYNCTYNYANDTTDLGEMSDCYYLGTIYGTNTQTDYMYTGYNCASLKYSTDNIAYIKIQRQYTGGSSSTARQVILSQTTVSFDSVLSNSSLLSDNNLLTQSSCNSQYAGYITQSACDSQYNGYIQPSDCPACSSCPTYTYYTPNGTGIINGDFIVRNIDSNYIYTELNDFGDTIGLDLYFNSNAIDNNYCESNNLCTVCNGGSGEINTGVNRSSLFLNGTQINSNGIIDIYAEDRMKTEVEYLNDTVDINITTDYDTNYINNVIDQEKLTPTNEDFESMILGLTEFIPYLFIALLFFVFIKITKRIRK